jgi:hypothetical protein
MGDLTCLMPRAGIDITANRLFGPQPRTATYVCIWEVHLGSFRASLSAWEARVFAATGDAFRMNFKDSVNAPAAEYAVPVEPDSECSVHHVVTA